MRTTSGRWDSTASTTAPPSPTAATTSTSGRIPSSSSSASRKTSLSSTSTIRTGGTPRTLFRGEQQRVVRLSALVQLDLELRPLGGEAVEERLELRRLRAEEQREQAAALSGDAVDDAERDLDEVRARRDGLACDEPEPVAALCGHAVGGRVAGGDRDLARRHLRCRAAHLRRVLGGRTGAVE